MGAGQLYATPLGNKAVQEVAAGKRFYYADHACVVTNSTYTKGAIECAEANDIHLLQVHQLVDLYLIIHNSPQYTY